MGRLTMGSSVVIATVAVILFPYATSGQIISVSQLVCSPSSLTSGSTTTCTATLSGAAPVGGTQVSLSSNNIWLPVSTASVTVPAEATSTTFTATAGSISSNETATLTATALNSVLLTWTGSVSPNVTDYNIYRSASSGGPYALVTTVGAVTSYTDHGVQNGQSYYYVATAVNSAGEDSAYSNQAAVAVPSGVSQTATVSLAAPVTPVALFSLACNPSSLSSGSATTCTVTLSNAAPAAGILVSLSSNSALLPAPAASVTVPAGAISTTFTAIAGTIPTTQTATLTATLNGVSQTATVSLFAAAVLSSLTCNPSSLSSGAATTCTVTLTNVASMSGTVVSLSSSDALLSVPAALVTPAGKTSATFTATAGTIATSQTAIVTAALNGVSQMATVDLVPPVIQGAPVSLSSLTCSPTSLSSGVATTCTVTLSNVAPSGGTVLSLSSNNVLLPAPGSITVLAGMTAAAFTSTAGTVLKNQSASLTATLGVVSQTARIGLRARPQERSRPHLPPPGGGQFLINQAWP